MKEVSCRVFEIVIPALKPKGVTIESIVAGTSVTPDQLRSKKERIDWPDYITIMKNLRPHFTDDEYVEVGRKHMRTPGLRFAFVIARLLMSPMDFYRWFSKPREGVGNQMFSCIVPSHREISENEIELDLVLPDGFEVCWDFYVISSGNMEELPRLLGLPPSKVKLTPLPRGGRFHITVPSKVPLFARIWRILTWPFTARAAARELREAHETLLERYEELEATRAELADYQANLEKLVDERTRELRDARDELAGTVEQLREAQSGRERFFGNISHEIRTPLSLIMLAAADIDARAGRLLDTRSSQSLGSVTDAARKLVRLVDELLLLAAGQEGKFEIHREPTDLAALAKQLAGAWRPAIEAAGLELGTSIPPTLVANVDPIAIERVASNLVSNAVKYTPRGGRVELVLVSREDGIQLSVLDTGAGIDPDLSARLFGRFERGAGDQTTTGTGIGLSIVKQLVEAHAGSVSVVPRTLGTEMRVLLPRVEAPEAAPPERGLSIEITRPKAGLASGTKLDPDQRSAGTIVIAEDDASLAEATARLLADRYTVVIGLDGESALELVKQHHPQLLITDIDMPKLNGIELARQFREHAGDRLAPIIMLSAVIDLGTRVAGLEAGAIDYINKPFDPRELIARVDAQFRMRELAVRLHRAEQLSSLGILTSGLAHELRNPANGIVNAIAPLKELLPPELTTPETGAGQLLEVMAGCAEQIAFLSRQLLGFRKGLQLETSPARLSTVVSRSIGMAHAALDEVQVRTQLAGDPELVCSAPLLVQAVTNLVENAGHAAGRKGWVEVAARTEGRTAVIEIADSGPGVPADLRERIFEPFFTTKPAGVGTGLGLSVARSIVHRHGGFLEVRERQGRTVFVIELPVDSVAEARADRYDVGAIPA